MEARRQPQGSFLRQCQSWSFETGSLSLTGLELHKEASLAGQRVLGIPMSLPHQLVPLRQTLLTVNSEV